MRPRLLHAALVPAVVAMVGGEEVRPGDHEGFGAAVLDHDLAGFACRALADGRWAPPPAVAQRVRAFHTERSLITGLLRLELAACAPIVAAATGAPAIVLKGPAAAARLYPEDPELRSYVDLDVLVPRDRLRVAADALREARGFTLAKRRRFFAALGEPWDGFAEEYGHELVVERRAAGRLMTVDLHWRLSDDPRGARLDHGVIAPRAVAIEGLPPGALAPDPVDELLLIAIHLVHHASPALVWCLDVARARDALGEQAWQRTFALAAEHGLSWALHAALDRTAAILCDGDRPRPEPAPRGPRTVALRALQALPETAGVHVGRLAAMPWRSRVTYTRRAGQAAALRVASRTRRTSRSA